MIIERKNTFIKFIGISSIAVWLFGCDASSGVQENTTASQSPDPVVVDYPIAYIERPIPRDEDGNIIDDEFLDPIAFKPGARLLIKDRAAVTAQATVITDTVFAAPIDPSMTPEEISEILPPLYDIKDLTVSRDGLRLLFSMRAPEIEDADDDEQPTWNIWEYDSETEMLRRFIESDLIAELGQDINPKYLADGNIVFSSTRQPRAKAILLDENKPQFDPGTEEDRDEATFTLHTMDEDGSDIVQITFNQSHDLSPVVLENGKIVFVRWNNYRGMSSFDFRGVSDGSVSLYITNPDGSGASPYYGYHSQQTGSDNSPAVLSRPIEMPDGRILSVLKSRSSEAQGGDIAFVAAEQYVEVDELNNGAVGNGPGQVSASVGQVNTDDNASSGGYYNSAYPMFDGTGRLIISWSACLAQGIDLGIFVRAEVSVDEDEAPDPSSFSLVNENGQPVDRNGNRILDGTAPIIPDASEIGAYPCGRNLQVLNLISTATPRYGIWTFDPSDNTQQPVVLAQENMMYTDAIVMEARPQLTFGLLPTSSDEQQALIDDNLGVVHIKSVYDFNGTDNTLNGIDAMADPLQTSAAERPARFLRLLKAVSLPNDDVYDFDNSAFGVSGGQMKDIIGYVPVEPDGSAKFKIPADVSFTFSVLDANGRRVPGYLGNRHQNWLSVRPGETRECGGCHAVDDEQPHGTLDADPPSSWQGAAGGAAFPNTVLIDAFDTPQPAPQQGQTMAEYYADMFGIREPASNILFEDEWSDETIVAKSAGFELAYSDMVSTAHPSSPSCQSRWNPLCRTVINYIDHIQPLWDANRQVLDINGILIEDRTCTSCHSMRDAMGAAQIPAGQLELTADQSPDNADNVVSYDELFRGDVPQVVIDGVLQDVMVPDFQRDENGDLVLDADGQPIEIMVPAPANGAYLSSRGARSHADIFAIFGAGGTHDSYLNAAELKLISEWLDIGAQYYNNPFDAPEN